MNFISVSYAVEEWIDNANRTYKQDECKKGRQNVNGGAIQNGEYECMSGDYYYYGDAKIENGTVYPGAWVNQIGKFGLFKSFVKNRISSSNPIKPHAKESSWGDGDSKIETAEEAYTLGDKFYRSKDYKNAINWYQKAVNNPNSTVYQYKAKYWLEQAKLLYKKHGDLEGKYSKNKGASFSELWGKYGGSELETDSDNSIKQSNYTLNTSIDTKAPIISLDQNDFVTVEGSIINLSGFIEDDSNVSEVNINGGLISIDDSGKFDRKMYLGLGKNKFTIEALDIFGNKASKMITVVRNKAIVKNKDKKLTPPTTQLTSNPNSVALIIGLDDYKSMPNAPWAESDASAFYDYAHNVLGIPFDRIRLTTGQESDGIGIWKSLEQWLPSQVDKNKSNIYVYFAGHGLASEDGKEAYLMPYDGDTSMLSRTAIPRKDIISGLDKLQARSVTLFMDTCYSGATKGGKQSLVASRGLRIVKKDVLSDLPANFTLFSAAANDETAISHPTQKNGLFSYWMMRGLGGEADSNNDDKLTNGELHAFISEKVQKTAISKGHIQHPQLIGNKDKVITSW